MQYLKLNLVGCFSVVWRVAAEEAVSRTALNARLIDGQEREVCEMGE